MTTAVQIYAPAQEMTAQADSDADLITLWLHGRSAHTLRSYGHDIKRFQAFMGRPLRQIRLRDLQLYSDSLVGLADSSKGRMLAAVKSLLSFGQRIGYLQYNIGAALDLPKCMDRLAERILPEDSVLAMIHHESKPRNACLLRLLYVSGMRVSELCGLCWRDLQPSTEVGVGQCTLFGKGKKTRAVRLTPTIWSALEKLRGAASSDDPVFVSQKHGHLDASQVARIVRKAAKRAGLIEKVSPHWMRHAHASHSLDRGCPIHLLQATLGHASISTTGRYAHAKPSESSSKYIAA